MFSVGWFIEGLDACKQALNNRPNPSIPTTDVLSMIRLVLENNNFSFNGKHYLQVEGTAIGSRLGMNSSFSANSAIFSVGWFIPRIINLNGAFSLCIFGLPFTEPWLTFRGSMYFFMSSVM
jgi:hypothetical protein